MQTTATVPLESASPRGSEPTDSDSDSPSGDSASSSPFANLRFVEIDRIVAQEGLDGRRAEKLAADIKRDCRLKHPVYLASFRNELYTSFDGHNRIEAFHELGYKNILSQVIAIED